MKQKDNMRQTFIECAVRVVARDGLDKTTTKLIAKEAGLNEAYIYRCFKNKEDLLSEAFYMEDVSFIGHIQNALPVMKQEGLPWKEKCFLLWKSCWYFILEKPDDCRFYLRYYYSANCQNYAYKRHLELYKPLFERVSPSFKADVNVAMLGHQIFDTMLSFAAHVQNGEIPNNSATTEWTFQQVYSFVADNARPELLESNE